MPRTQIDITVPGRSGRPAVVTGTSDGMGGELLGAVETAVPPALMTATDPAARPVA